MGRTIYEVMTSGILECIHSTKYKSGRTRRFDICNRYNSSISYILQHVDTNSLDKAISIGLDKSRFTAIKGCKGLITKSICDSLSDDELDTYIEVVVCPTIYKIFGDRKF